MKQEYEESSLLKALREKKMRLSRGLLRPNASSSWAVDSFDNAHISLHFPRVHARWEEDLEKDALASEVSCSSLTTMYAPRYYRDRRCIVCYFPALRYNFVFNRQGDRWKTPRDQTRSAKFVHLGARGWAARRHRLRPRRSGNFWMLSRRRRRSGRGAAGGQDYHPAE